MIKNDRIYPRKDAAAYPGRDYIDMVFYVPMAENNTRRLWLLTEAKSPEIMIDHFKFKPLKKALKVLDFSLYISQAIDSQLIQNRENKLSHFL